MNALSEVCASQQRTVPAFIALFFINNYGIHAIVLGLS
jgi:hypothetical protein